MNRLLSQDKFRFLISGILGFIADAGSLWILTSVLNFHLVLFDIIVVANLIAVGIGISVSFVMHRNFSFQARKGSLTQQGQRYLFVYVFSYILNQLIFGIFSVQLGLTYLISKVLVSLLQMIWNYFLFKYVVFQ